MAGRRFLERARIALLQIDEGIREFAAIGCLLRNSTVFMAAPVLSAIMPFMSGLVMFRTSRAARKGMMCRRKRPTSVEMMMYFFGLPPFPRKILDYEAPLPRCENAKVKPRKLIVPDVVVLVACFGHSDELFGIL